MKILKQLSHAALVAALALSMTATVSAHDETSTQTQSSQNYSVTHEGTVVTVLREDGTPVANGSVQVKTEANDPNSTLATETTDDNGAYDYGAYVADGAAILRISDGSTTIIYYLLTDTITYDSKNKDGSGQPSSSFDPTMAICGGAVALVVIGVVTVINVKRRVKHDPELGELD